MDERSSVAFVIPCFNEELTVGTVIADCRRLMPEAAIYVFDNNSTDKTMDRARASGAVVIPSTRQGKGAVIQHAFSILREDSLIMLDGDGTYDVAAARNMVHAIAFERYEMVVCNRRSETGAHAFPRFHKFGNWLFSSFVSVLLGQKVSDVFSGYRAVSRDFYESIVLESGGFEIESELTLKAVSQGFSVKEIEAPYGSRPQGSHSKLRTFHDGFRILKFIFLAMRDCRPLMFFSSVSAFCFCLSVLAGIAPIMDFVRDHYVYTVPRAILAASLMVLSMLSFAVGLVLDSQIRHLRQQSKLVRRWLGRNRAEPAKAPERRAG